MTFLGMSTNSFVYFIRICRSFIEYTISLDKKRLISKTLVDIIRKLSGDPVKNLYVNRFCTIVLSTTCVSKPNLVEKLTSYFLFIALI